VSAGNSPASNEQRIEKGEMKMGEQAIAGIFVLSCVYVICNLAANGPINYSSEITRFVARTLSVVGLDLVLSSVSSRPVSSAEVAVISILILILTIFTALFRQARDLQAGLSAGHRLDRISITAIWRTAIAGTTSPEVCPAYNPSCELLRL
jgi:hypothetical protein